MGRTKIREGGAWCEPVCHLAASSKRLPDGTGWNRSIHPMLCIGRRLYIFDCIVMPFTLPGCHVWKYAFLLIREKPKGRAGGGRLWRSERSD